MIAQVFVNEISGRFNLRKPKGEKPTMIYFCSRVNGKQLKLSTGVKIYPDQWNAEKQTAYINCRLSELDNINNTCVNEKLSDIQVRFKEYKKYLCNQPQYLDDSELLLRKYIYKDRKMKGKPKEDALRWYRKSISNDFNIKDSSKDEYLTKLNEFEKFLKHVDKLPLSFDDINITLIREFENYLKGKVVNSKTGATMKISSVGSSIQRLISVLNRSEERRVG